MDFQSNTVVIFMFMLLFSIVIVAVMTPLLLWQPYEEELNRELEMRIFNLEEIDIQRLRWNISIPGSDILNLIEGNGGRDFYIFVQTKAQNGWVVNYGKQLRQANSQSLHIHSGLLIFGAEQDEWIYNHVISARDLFGFAPGNQLLNEPTPGLTIPQRPPSPPIIGPFSGINFTNPVTGNARIAVSNVLFPSVGNQVIGVGSDPLISFFCPVMTREEAHNIGRTFATMGTFFVGTPALQPGNVNQNTARARVQDSIWYINGMSHFLSIGLVDATGALVGFYLEEQGVMSQTNFLAMAFELGEPIIDGVFRQP